MAWIRVETSVIAEIGGIVPAAFCGFAGDQIRSSKQRQSSATQDTEETEIDQRHSGVDFPGVGPRCNAFFFRRGLFAWGLTNQSPLAGECLIEHRFKDVRLSHEAEVASVAGIGRAFRVVTIEMIAADVVEALHACGL